MLLTQARLLSLAERELEEAFDFYSAERPALGQQFVDCIEATALQAMHHPEAGTLVTLPRLRRAVRRFRVDEPFPYDLVATIVDAKLVIIAIAHHERRPAYWIQRMATLR